MTAANRTWARCAATAWSCRPWPRHAKAAATTRSATAWPASVIGLRLRPAVGAVDRPRRRHRRGLLRHRHAGRRGGQAFVVSPPLRSGWRARNECRGCPRRPRPRLDYCAPPDEEPTLQDLLRPRVPGELRPAYASICWKVRRRGMSGFFRTRMVRAPADRRVGNPAPGFPSGATTKLTITYLTALLVASSAKVGYLRHFGK